MAKCQEVLDLVKCRGNTTTKTGVDESRLFSGEVLKTHEEEEMIIAGRWFSLALFNLIFIQKLQAIRWLAIDRSSEFGWNITHCRFHARQKIFVGDQTRICKRQLPIMKYVSQAVEYTKSACQKQMSTRRWNCSSILRAPRFYKDLATNTKESGFVHALSSAALTYTVTYACSIGRLKVCGCGRTPKQKLKKKIWKWGGCSDNVAYGYRFSKGFTDHQDMAVFRTSLEGALMVLHNNEVGRRAVRDKLEIICRCHGVSGDCQIKTCFRRLSNFKVVAEHIRKKYDRVIRVKSEKSNERITLVNKRSRKKKKLSPRQLIALEPSPNFCLQRPRYGSLGTKGRTCKPRGHGHGTCKYLCCGRGFEKAKVVRSKKCNCKLYWCCEVRCDTCTKRVVVHKCK